MPLGANKVALLGSSGVVTDTSILLATDNFAGSSSVEFTLPTAYKQVVFGFINWTGTTNGGTLSFQVSTDGSTYTTTITSTTFSAIHNESNTVATLAYRAGQDQAQGTGEQDLFNDHGNDADMGSAGRLTVFNPSSTTYVKNWYFRGSASKSNPAAADYNYSGYFNTTTALSTIRFKPSAGTMSGTIKMWGVL